MRCALYLRVSTTEQAQRDGEEGFSIPAQREACIRHIRDQDWTVVDEYSDRGESARSADRPQLQLMLRRIADDRDIDAVVVHKIDRLARNMEDHIAIRAALRRWGVQLVSVSEKLEETASGKLVEGIHALMAEFYSSNLSAEVKKGMSQKLKMGGCPHWAPLGYLNSRESIGGRSVAHVILDPERASLVTQAFELYASGQHTIETLQKEMARRGLTCRPTKKYSSKPISLSYLHKMFANKFYMGIVEWGGVEYPGRHEPIVDPQTWTLVQERLASRSGSGTRERKHSHYLKGLLACEICGRKLGIMIAKGRYTYFYCLGQRSKAAPTGCREAFVPADVLERQVEELYQRVQLPDAWKEKLRVYLEQEVIARQDRNSGERQFALKRLSKLEDERRKLLDAYYAGAVTIATLKSEQQRIDQEFRAGEEILAVIDAKLDEWKETLELSMDLAAKCGAAYQKAGEKVRRLFNAAVFESIAVRDGRITEVRYRPPFAAFFGPSSRDEEFDYRRVAGEEGIEPSIGDPKSPALPLGDSPAWASGGGSPV